VLEASGGALEIYEASGAIEITQASKALTGEINAAERTILTETIGR